MLGAKLQFKERPEGSGRSAAVSASVEQIASQGVEYDNAYIPR
jgi:hypothetical protein